jgi:hypothetical protein
MLMTESFIDPLPRRRESLRPMSIVLHRSTRFGIGVSIRAAVWILACLILGCSDGGGGSSEVVGPPIVVDSTGDGVAAAAVGTTLREALAIAGPRQPIHFDPTLDGATISLRVVGEPHTLLKGEVMGIQDTPSGPVSYLVGYFDRDYGRSALYARQDVVIDASDLPSGITIAWTGGRADPARVLAVAGDLTLRNVRITGGVNLTEDISTGDPDAQPWTLARGGGLAVWGRARLEDCEIFDNHVEGDFDPSRDRGAFGGGVYANLVAIENCVVSGNSVLGGGAAGGGVFSVGGAIDPGSVSTIERSAITGNRIQGLFTYGGGVYTDGGGIGNRKRLVVRNSTLARNLVEPAPGLPPFVLAAGYWRGGGLYMSNGYVEIDAVTIVENEVYGVPRTDDLDKRNLAGGVAATIGNAHAIEDMVIGHSIVAGNTVHEIGGTSYDHDVFTGSTFYFRSKGYNRLGVVDFGQMLVPVGERLWASLSRRHFPQSGDLEALAIDEVVERATGIARSTHIRSVGTDAGELAVLHYRPWDRSLDQIPPTTYPIDEVFGEYWLPGGGIDDFLSIVLGRIESQYGLAGFAAAFTADFEAFLQSVDLDDTTPGNQPYTDPSGNPILTLADTHWFGPAQTWPRELPNHPYIHFWHRLDEAMHAEGIPGMGSETLGDAAWQTLFSSGPLAENPAIQMSIWTRQAYAVRLEEEDQLAAARPVNGMGDVGAIESP